MSISASDVVPFTQARATLSDLAEQVKAGAEKIITKNGESYVPPAARRPIDQWIDQCVGGQSLASRR